MNAKTKAASSSKKIVNILSSTIFINISNNSFSKNSFSKKTHAHEGAQAEYFSRKMIILLVPRTFSQFLKSCNERMFLDASAVA